ncbi:MAG: hypothetical protein J4G14_01955 [Dehalococcoidia bacterium]|nr:hypothetical protein [Dehalococcoidia bacterium]
MEERSFSFEESQDFNDPFGMSKYSIRRYSVQHILLVLTVLGLLAAINVQAVLIGELGLIITAAMCLISALAMAALVVLVGLRTVAVEVWIRRLGMGDFEYRVKPWGRDEVSKACLALETLRLNSIRAMQLDRVQQLSDELSQKNEDLEEALEELHRSQDQIISQQKLAELGELSSGVAHEIRNPLQFIRNFAVLSKDIGLELSEMIEGSSVTDREEAEELIKDLVDNMDRVVHHSDRANGIVSAMLMLDRGTGGGFRPLDLNSLVVEQTNLAHRSVQAQDPGFSAEVYLELDDSMEEVVAVPEDIARVVANIVTNACQAMADKANNHGKDYIPELSVGTLITEEAVVMTVRDNGVGMTPETMERMFNPFFTTKEGGRNTGLGLSLAFDVIREHGGNIEAESELGLYTEMKVVLPKQSEKREESGTTLE